MAEIDSKKLKRQAMIYRIVQTVLVGMLVYLAINFQSLFALRGRTDQFINSIITAIVVQLILIYPIYKLAWRDAGIEINSSLAGLSAEQMSALRRKRMISDLWKIAAVAFFAVFVIMVPDVKKAAGALLVLASTIFSFLLTCLMYFQCYNFSAKKQIKAL